MGYFVVKPLCSSPFFPPRYSSLFTPLYLPWYRCKEQKRLFFTLCLLR
nr:MAG TPA: hypothetical protein [Caudoviricetes sp.]